MVHCMLCMFSNCIVESLIKKCVRCRLSMAFFCSICQPIQLRLDMSITRNCKSNDDIDDQQLSAAHSAASFGSNSKCTRGTFLELLSFVNTPRTELQDLHEVRLIRPGMSLQIVTIKLFSDLCPIPRTNQYMTKLYFCGLILEDLELFLLSILERPFFMAQSNLRPTHSNKLIHKSPCY